jgi:hypothetical protein
VKRAAVLIGVDRSGQLPELHDAASGARRMEAWAKEQGFDPIHVFTDEGGAAVEVTDVKKAIFAIVEKQNAEQLLVYFAGHGVNIGYSERWLLSDAPRDTQAAVNVPGSALLAQNCGITHVVLMSDACRTAAAGIQAQSVTGSEIFPSGDAAGTANGVDQFYACTLGRPALEITDPNDAAGAFRALYTAAVLDGLQGSGCSVDWVSEASGRVGYVRPWPLKQYLPGGVLAQIKAAKLIQSASQVPDAIITSPPDAWISRLTDAGEGGGEPELPEPVPLTSPAAVTTTGLSAELLRSTLAGEPGADEILEGAGFEELIAPPVAVRVVEEMTATAAQLATPFGPSHHETACGFKVRGARFLEGWSPRADVQKRAPDNLVVVDAVWPGVSVLLKFEDGTGLSLPAIPGFITGLTVADGELVEVAYEPSDNNLDRWPDFEQRASEVRRLRGLASAATRDGVFRLTGEDAPRLARQMQYAKGLDPSLAVYAAYAYQDLHRLDLIREMSGYMRGDLGGRLFDVALLAREIDGTTVGTDPSVLSFMPMLSQGWALLSALRISLPPLLEGIQRWLLPSSWTLFAPPGVEQLGAVLQAGEVL